MTSDNYENKGLISHKMLLHSAGEFDVESIQFLNLDHREITNIDALQECKNLVRLNLSFNSITFLGPLRELRTITFLNLSANRITSLDPLVNLELLEELNVAGNQLGSVDRLRCLCMLPSFKKLRLQDKIRKLTNPVCQKDDYHATVIKMMSNLLVFDGQRVKGRGSELYRMCCELDKQLESFAHDQMCPCDSCATEVGAGRSFGPVVERPLPEPWLKSGYFAPVAMECKMDKSIQEFEKVLRDCKKLDENVAIKISALTHN